MRTMTDLERAIAHLPDHTLVLCRGEDTLISDKRGIAPIHFLKTFLKCFTGYEWSLNTPEKAAHRLNLSFF